MKHTLWLSALLLACASAAQAQKSTRAADSAAVLVAGDTTAAGGHNWFVALLRKIARKSDDEVTGPEKPAADDAAEVVATPAVATARSFKSRKDSIAWEGARTVAGKSKGYRLVVDLFGKTLRVIDGTDTLRTASVATAKNETLEYAGNVWRFETPRGVRTVLGKDKDPVWTPPEWHFAEIALEHDLKVAQLHRGRVVKLKSGTKLLTKGDEVGVIYAGETEFRPLLLDEHIVFDKTLFIPPAGTKHRVIEGELGHYRLDMGQGYLLHGTPYARSIGAAVTHGCIRLRDEDIEWLYENIPVGTKVYIY